MNNSGKDISAEDIRAELKKMDVNNLDELIDKILENPAVKELDEKRPASVFCSYRTFCIYTLNDVE